MTSNDIIFAGEIGTFILAAEALGIRSRLIATVQRNGVYLLRQ